MFLANMAFFDYMQSTKKAGKLIPHYFSFVLIPLRGWDFCYKKHLMIRKKRKLLCKIGMFYSHWWLQKTNFEGRVGSRYSNSNPVCGRWTAESAVRVVFAEFLWISLFSSCMKFKICSLRGSKSDQILSLINSRLHWFLGIRLFGCAIQVF